MKKALLTKLMLLLCALIAGSSSAWATEQVYKSLTFTADDNTKVGNYTSSWTEIVGTTSWTIANFSNNNWQWNDGGNPALKVIKCGRKQAGSPKTDVPSVATITTNAEINEAITKVVVTLTAIDATDYNGIKLYMAPDNTFDINEATTVVVSVSPIPTAAGNMTITIPEAKRAANQYYKLEFDTKGSTGNNGHTALSKVDYYADIAVAVEAPTFSVTAGTYKTAQSVELSCATGGATVYYTTDGTTPTDQSTEYAGAINVNTTTTIKAIAKKSSDYSSVASATYTIVSIAHAGTQVDPYTVADARNAIDALDGNKTGVYVTGIVCTGGTSLSSGKMNYYISDDGSETNKFQIFKGKGIDGDNFTATSEVQVGDVVVVTGNIKKYNTTYELDEDNQLVSIKKKPADPVISPAAGNVAVGTQVTITCAPNSATIYYTTDGNDPTDQSTEYTGAITVNSDVTIKAIAYNDGLTSAIVSAAYTAIANSYTVTLGDDNSDLTETSPGAGVTLPTRDDSGSYEFVGWSETNVTSETNNKPTIIPAGAYNPTQIITLYPVYVRPNYSVANVTINKVIKDYANANSWANSTQYTTVNMDANITATATGGGNTGKYYTNGNDWRFYQNENAKVTIAAEKGHALKTVKFTFTVGNTGTLTYNNAALESGTAVNVSGSSAEFVVKNSTEATNGQVKISAIEVVYTAATYLSAPEKVSVEIPAAGYATYCNSTKALSFGGVTAYKVSAVGANSVTLEEIAEAPANTPVILKAAAGNYDLSVVASAAAVGTNKLLVSDGSVTGGDGIYALAEKNSVVGFYKVANNVTIPAGKCYLNTNTNAPEYLAFSFGGETTGINEVRGKMEDVSGKVYNLAGQRVAQPTKGLYIVNGKKVIVK